MIETLAAVSRTASLTVLNTGTFSSKICPPRPGVTPATTFVPYAIERRACWLPSPPVIPCTSRRVFSSTRTLMGNSVTSPATLPRRVGRRDRLGRCLAEVVGGDDRQAGLLDDAQALFEVGAGEAHHH